MKQVKKHCSQLKFDATSTKWGEGGECNRCKSSHQREEAIWNRREFWHRREGGAACICCRTIWTRSFDCYSCCNPNLLLFPPPLQSLYPHTLSLHQWCHLCPEVPLFQRRRDSLVLMGRTCSIRLSPAHVLLGWHFSLIGASLLCQWATPILPSGFVLVLTEYIRYEID